MMTLSSDGLSQLFFHAGVDTTRVAMAPRHVSRALMYMKRSRTHPCKQWFEKNGATQTDAESLMKADDNYTLEQRNWKTVDLLLSFVSTCCPKLWRLSTNLRSARQVVRMNLQNSIFQHLCYKTPIKTSVTLESVLTRMHKITR